MVLSFELSLRCKGLFDAVSNDTSTGGLFAGGVVTGLTMDEYGGWLENVGRRGELLITFRLLLG